MNGRATTLLADQPLSTACTWAYFEIFIVNKGQYGAITVGLATEDHPLGELPGKVAGSYGWSSTGYRYEHGKALRFIETNGDSGLSIWNTGDVVGCGYNNCTGEVFYTKNGIFIGTAHSYVARGLYPAVALAGPKEKVYANFGHMPFMFNFAFAPVARLVAAAIPVSAAFTATMNSSDADYAFHLPSPLQRYCNNVAAHSPGLAVVLQEYQAAAALAARIAATRAQTESLMSPISPQQRWWERDRSAELKLQHRQNQLRSSNSNSSDSRGEAPIGPAEAFRRAVPNKALSPRAVSAYLRGGLKMSSD
eukprot:TRINITY_DN8126_c0_g1_i2.p1 TRINITY_DN8126_c0_g1~~TRINITY_DN8126_c0_g1_i2.p1  ORF type:complete len:307 (+),score=52.09 TRINITY_DN8126_c0_g1_i2:237-1157(+)